MAKYWCGDPPDKCDIDGVRITKTFVDGRTRAYASWAIMCPLCFEAYGVGLGTGNGQEYQRQDDGRWLKVGG